jgi:hypothetical protein
MATIRFFSQVSNAKEARWPIAPNEEVLLASLQKRQQRGHSIHSSQRGLRGTRGKNMG